MQKITNIEELRASILLLKAQQVNEGILLKEEFKITYNKLKPINLLKGFLKDVTSDPDLKENLLGTTMGIAAGYLSKKVAVGSTHNPIKKILGTLIQVGVTSIVSKNADGIKAVALNLFNNLIRKKETVK